MCGIKCSDTLWIALKTKEIHLRERLWRDEGHCWRVVVRKSVEKEIIGMPTKIVALDTTSSKASPASVTVVNLNSIPVRKPWCSLQANIFVTYVGGVNIHCIPHMALKFPCHRCTFCWSFAAVTAIYFGVTIITFTTYSEIEGRLASVLRGRVQTRRGWFLPPRGKGGPYAPVLCEWVTEL